MSEPNIITGIKTKISHTLFLFSYKLKISLDTIGNHMGENSKLGWLMELPSQDIFLYTISSYMAVRISALQPCRYLPQRRFLALICIRGSFASRAIVGLEGL
jgi:hypothetical protein